MFFLRQLFHRAAAPPRSETETEPETASDHKLPLFKSDIGYVQLPARESRTKHRKLPLIVKSLLTLLALFSAIFSGQSIVKFATSGYNTILRGSHSQAHIPCGQDVSRHRFGIQAAPPWEAPALDRDWIVSCSSEADDDHRCTNVIDGDEETWWQSNDDPHGNHWIKIDLKTPHDVTGLGMTPMEGFPEPGMVQRHIVEVATETGEFDVVALGSWRTDDTSVKYAIFEPRSVRYVRLTAIDASGNTEFVSISNIDIYTKPTLDFPVGERGKWGITLDFPLVPVTAFLNPFTHKLITMASYLSDHFNQGQERETYSATWDPHTNVVQQVRIRDAPGHDMFCPGTSFDEKGNVIVTGGDTPEAFSIYDSTEDRWTTPNERIAVGRGYQGQTFLPNGKTFMIGGQWSGNLGGEAGRRPGEIYDPATGQWNILHGVPSEDIQMDAQMGRDGTPGGMVEWRQHHPWLFSWTNNTIFHAGPSKRMNWIFTDPPHGKIEFGGTRPGDDTVCGVHAMYDAEQGKILLAGGSAVYHYYLDRDHCALPNCQSRGIESTQNAFQITLPKNPGTEVVPRVVAPMNHQRIFANGIILPTGKVLVVGGMRLGEPFHDETWQSVPEIYSPEDDEWTFGAPNSIPRGYHSWGMLLPDARVVVGGAGLRFPTIQGDTNHMDAQIYHPAYLFDAHGNAVDQPKIESVDKHTYKVGDKITIKTNVKVDDTASLIRYSAATHALNNDLRRIKLDLKKEGDNEYSAKIPSDPGVTLPGYWMLFVLENGVPSHAETVQILAE